MAAIGIALILLTIAGPYLKDGVAWLYAAAKSLTARLPSAGGFLSAKVELPIWKAALLVAAFWMISAGGGGLTLPDWKLPAIPGWPAWVVTAKPPFPADVLSVLVFEESADHGKYTADQLNVIQATDEKSVKAVVEAKGGLFKVLDQHTAAALTNAEPWLKEAFAVASKNPPPWVVGATKTRGFSTPLTTEADLHKQLGGL